MAAALGVEPHVLLMRSEDALRWIADNSSYEQWLEEGATDGEGL